MCGGGDDYSHSTCIPHPQSMALVLLLKQTHSFDRSGSNIDRLQWQLNGNEVAGTVIDERTLELNVDQPTLADSGEYICVAFLSNTLVNEVSGGFLNVYCKSTL